jgi:hypothetical protein
MAARPTRTEGSAEIDQGLTNIVAVAIEELVQPDLELILDGRKQQCRNNGRYNARHHARRFESRPEKFSNQDHHGCIQADDARRCQGIRHTPLENDVDIHQAVAMNGIPERNRNQDERNDRKIDVGCGRQTPEPRNGLQNEVWNDGQHRSACDPLHLLPQLGSSHRAIRLDQNDRAQDEVQTEVEISKIVQKVAQHNRGRSEADNAVDKGQLSGKERRPRNVNQIQQSPPLPNQFIA